MGETIVRGIDMRSKTIIINPNENHRVYENNVWIFFVLSKGRKRQGAVAQISGGGLGGWERRPVKP